MPLNDERPASTSSGNDHGSDAESPSERRDGFTSASDPESSRDGFTSDGSCKHCTPSPSPVKILTMDEVVESAKELSNLCLAHELIVNPSFHVEPNRLPPNSIWKVVRDIAHKAFWDKLESELNDDPPEYRQAIRLLEEIRELLLSFLNPDASRMRTQIMGVLDMDLIQQQADNDAVDIQGLAAYIITTMEKMCAPIREEEIKKLRENTDNIVTLYREIFRVLDLMTLDMVNHENRRLAEYLKVAGVEYERETFQSILDKTPTALNRTTSWIKSALEMLSANTPSEQTEGQGKGQKVVPGPFQILDAAFLIILRWDYAKAPPPETWMTDEVCLQEIQRQLQQCQVVNGVLLIVHNTIGGPIQGLPSLSDRLKRMTSVLLDGMHNPNFNLDEALESVSAQICCEINKSLTERSYSSLTPALQASLKGQICSITQKNNPIRTLVEDRLQHFFKAVISDPKPQVRLEQVPAGLTTIKPELMAIAAKFISLVKYNRDVYGHFYADIIRKLLFSSSPPAGDPPQESQ
ncbi:T-complex protein 11-like protein 2 [Brachionichthys hirsutus]|uniref:T-complex protein 11-like protein 2 n=1 Tax=Brachionichthys hirsutus TaxID=412623 RepID=UPI003604BDB2